jgi:hypothetical protein
LSARRSTSRLPRRTARDWQRRPERGRLLVGRGAYEYVFRHIRGCEPGLEPGAVRRRVGGGLEVSTSPKVWSINVAAVMSGSLPIPAECGRLIRLLEEKHDHARTVNQQADREVAHLQGRMTTTRRPNVDQPFAAAQRSEVLRMPRGISAPDAREHTRPSSCRRLARLPASWLSSTPTGLGGAV